VGARRSLTTEFSPHDLSVSGTGSDVLIEVP